MLNHSYGINFVFSSLRQHFNRFIHSKFIKNVLIVATGIAAAQAISLAFMPFLTRLYGPSAFGELASFTALLNIITPLATLGYSNAIVLPKTTEGAHAVARLSLCSSVVVSLLVLVLITLFESELAALTGLSKQSKLLYIIPLVLLLIALFSVASQAAIREGFFKAKTTAYVASNFLMNSSKLIGGLLFPSGITLIIILAIDRMINFLMLMVRVPKKDSLDIKKWFGTANIRQTAIEQKDFCIYRMPQSILNAATMGLPVLLLTTFFGPSIAGQYSLTLLVLSAPVMLLSESVGEVFYPKITRAILSKDPAVKKLITKSTLLLGLGSLIIFLPIIIVGPYIFPMIFGEEWFRAGEYAQWLSIWLIGTLASRTCVAAFPALKLQSYLLFQEIISIVLRVGVLYIGFKFFESDLVAVALFSLVGFGLTAAMIVVTYIRLKKINLLTT